MEKKLSYKSYYIASAPKRQNIIDWKLPAVRSASGRRQFLFVFSSSRSWQFEWFKLSSLLHPTKIIDDTLRSAYTYTSLLLSYESSKTSLHIHLPIRQVNLNWYTYGMRLIRTSHSPTITILPDQASTARTNPLR